MNQITIDNILLVEVPEDAEPYILESANGKQQGLFYKQPGNSSPPWLVLPPGNWQFIGTTDAITEEIAEKIVEGFYFGKGKLVKGAKNAFVDYTRNINSDNWHHVDTALESYQSWLRANSINDNIRYAILKLNP